MAESTLVLPGQSLGSALDVVPNSGTYIHEVQVYSSLAGLKFTSPSKPTRSLREPENSSNGSRASLQTISVLRSMTTTTRETSSGIPAWGHALPVVDDIVLGLVTRTSPRQASIQILSIGNVTCQGDGFPALIRVQDVRATEKDRVKIGESFRPGDVVRAIVISLGDQANYYLSTARNDLGVVMAKSEVGNLMRPINWKEFEDAVLGRRELRKVAKPA